MGWFSHLVHEMPVCSDIIPFYLGIGLIVFIEPGCPPLDRHQKNILYRMLPWQLCSSLWKVFPGVCLECVYTFFCDNRFCYLVPVPTAAEAVIWSGPVSVSTECHYLWLAKLKIRFQPMYRPHQLVFLKVLNQPMHFCSGYGFCMFRPRDGEAVEHVADVYCWSWVVLKNKREKKVEFHDRFYHRGN